MTDDPGRENEIAELRDALAGLMGRNIELEQRIETLERERNELGVDDVARSLVRAARLAEAGMAEAGADDEGQVVRYVIPRLDVALRGNVGRRGDGFGMRFPGPEERAAPGGLSTISMSVAHVPLTAPVPDRGLRRLGAGLEAAQATLSAWDRDRGRSAAGEIADGATRLLGIRATWGDAESVAAIRALADAFERFNKQAATELDPAALERSAASSRALSVMAGQLGAARGVTPEDLAAVGSALVDIADAISTLRE